MVPEAMLDLNGQEQNSFAHVSEDFEVAGNGFADNGYPPVVGLGESNQFDDSSVENFLI